MPSVTGMVQEATGLRWPSTSTRHWRQAPTGSSSGWSQNRGIWTPICSAARMISVPLGTATSKPSIVQWTASGGVCGPGVPGGIGGRRAGGYEGHEATPTGSMRRVRPSRACSSGGSRAT